MTVTRPGLPPFDVLNVRIGHPRYQELVGQIRADAVLLAQRWSDAERTLDEHPGKV